MSVGGSLSWASVKLMTTRPSGKIAAIGKEVSGQLPVLQAEFTAGLAETTPFPHRGHGIARIG